MRCAYRDYDLNQPLLLSPDLREWLPDKHLALLIADALDELDLSAFYTARGGGVLGGRFAYHPLMMVRLLAYGYCTGTFSSRRIEAKTYDDLAFRCLSGDQHPDHDSIASFRKRHLDALAGLFGSILELCRKAGMVKLGHVAIDGSKILANASKHKAMSYDRMCQTEERLEKEVVNLKQRARDLLEKAEEIDATEDSQYGKGKRGDEIPEELQRRESRLRVIRKAKAELEAEARQAAKAAQEIKEKAQQRRGEPKDDRQKGEAPASQELKTGVAPVASPPIAEESREVGEVPSQACEPEPAVADQAEAQAVPAAGESRPEDAVAASPSEVLPNAKAQRNFTDPDSRIMKDGATKAFVQAYNAQIVVDDAFQVIVAAELTQQVNDVRQLVPMLEAVQQNLGQFPEKALADAGYFSEANLTDERLRSVDLLVPGERQKHDPDESGAPSLALCLTTLTIVSLLFRSLGRRRKISREAKQIYNDAFLVAISTATTLLPGPCLLPLRTPTARDTMRYKLRTADGKAAYAKRKSTVEPVFGQVKEARGFRRFSFRGFLLAGAEWKFVSATHNLLKLIRFRASGLLQTVSVMAT